jgi:GNAT superfamily N-acetyltransferase
MPGVDERDFIIDTDKSRLQLDTIHRFLSESYWAKGVPIDVLRRAIESSLCFGVYDGDQQVGFARVISDYATFAYLADVFVLESHRSRGLAGRLMNAVVSHPQLQGLPSLGARHSGRPRSYAKLGFTPLAAPERFMELHNPLAYAIQVSPDGFGVEKVVGCEDRSADCADGRR